MTIDEAIAEEKHKAENAHVTLKNLRNIDKYIERCNQIANWLEELKELREQKSNWLLGYDTSRDLFYYNKALDDFIAEIEKQTTFYCGKDSHLREIAEQLKK